MAVNTVEAARVDSRVPRRLRNRAVYHDLS
jgi:hypothetical protein